MEKRKPERRDRAAAPPNRSGRRMCGFPRQPVNSLQSHPLLRIVLLGVCRNRIFLYNIMLISV